MDDSRELFDEIVSLFLKDTPQYLQAIRLALEQGNAEQLKHNAHALKGMVSVFAAERTIQAADRVEKLGDGANGSELVRVLEGELKTLRDALVAYQWI